MKQLINIALVLAVVFFTSCEKDVETGNLSSITYFATIEVQGAGEMFVDVGSSFTDPGAIALEAGEEIPVDVQVVGTYSGYKGTTVNTDVPDKYVISYSAVNSDGFASNSQRVVWVYATDDLSEGLSGLYRSTVVRNGTSSADYDNMEYVMIWKTNDNTYMLGDAIGGYYDLGRHYGDDFRAAGMTITVNDLGSNDFSFGGPIGVGAFGGSLEMLDMSVDSGSKTINFSSEWDFGFLFEVALVQI